MVHSRSIGVADRCQTNHHTQARLIPGMPGSGSFGLVSLSFRQERSIMLGMLSSDNEKEQGQATGFVRKSTDFIGFCTELAKETFYQIRRANVKVQLGIKLIAGHWRFSAIRCMMNSQAGMAGQQAELVPLHQRSCTAADIVRVGYERMAPGELPLTLVVDSRAVVERHITASVHQSCPTIWPEPQTPPRGTPSAAPMFSVAREPFILPRNRRFLPMSSNGTVFLGFGKI